VIEMVNSEHVFIKILKELVRVNRQLAEIKKNLKN